MKPEDKDFLKDLVDKVMGDMKFYIAFKKDPVAALHEQGLTLKPEQIEALKKLDWKVLDKIGAVFGYRVT